MSLYNVLDLKCQLGGFSAQKVGWNYSVQIATAQFITECDGEFYKIARAFLLRHDTIYYKMRQVLHGALKRKRPNGHNTSIPYFVIIS